MSHVNELLLDVQRRVKELDERENILLQKEKEIVAANAAATNAAAAAVMSKSVPLTAKYQSTSAECLLPTQNSSMLSSLLPIKFSSGYSVSAILSLLHDQQTEERVNRLRDESESLRFNIMKTLLQTRE